MGLFPVVCLLSLLFTPAVLCAQEPTGADIYNEMILKAMAPASASQPGNWDARIKKISGDVRVRASGEGEWAPLDGTIRLAASDAIKTADGVAEIYLDDKGVVSVGRNTELLVETLTRNDSGFGLKFGSVAAKVRNFLEEKLQMRIRTPSAVCAVRGTEFAVEYSQLTKDTGVAVFDEGSVAVNILGPKGETIGEALLLKNTELAFGPGQKRFRPTPLSRMVRYRARVIGMRKTLPALRKTWKRRGVAGKEAASERSFRPGSAVKGKRPVRAKKKPAGGAGQKVK